MRKGLINLNPDKDQYTFAGVFLDMVTYPRDTCYCTYCTYCRKKAVRLGLNIHQPSDLVKLWEISLESFMEEARAIVKEANPNMGFTSNCRWFVGGVGVVLARWGVALHRAGTAYSSDGRCRMVD